MRKNGKSPAFIFWISTSIAVHGFLFVLIIFKASHQKQPERKNIQIELVEKSPENAQVQAQIVARSKEQVVEQDNDNKKDEVVPETSFLSEHNNSVKHQTSGSHKNNAEKENSKKAVKSLPEFTPVSADDFVTPKEFEPYTITDQNDKVGSQSIDYIKDLDPGVETLLNSKEFVFYAYYARIRRQVNRLWEPLVRQKIASLKRSGRAPASSEDKVTKLLVTLDRSGRIFKAQVIGDSGVQDLDQVAIESFNRASPFSNPPEGMIDPDGFIKIRWDFVLEGRG